MEIAKYFSEAKSPKNVNMNMVGASSEDCFSHYAFSAVSDINQGNWIFDSGASVHICCNSNLMTDLIQLKEPQKIFLPMGAVQWVRYVRKVQINPSIILSEVLLAPNFSHNLLSVARLCVDRDIRCLFLSSHCVIQIVPMITF